ncbi:MAG: hypothetical protein V1787_00700 [Candidatus Micrarchaeota archaeon]
MAKRAQVGVEMFLVFSIALLVLFWFSNYLNAFSSSAQKIGANEQQKLALKDLAKLANDVCVMRANLTVKAPCITVGSESMLYRLYGTLPANVIRMNNTFTNHSSAEKVNCNVDVMVPDYVRCTSREMLCMYKSGDDVVITRGACT